MNPTVNNSFELEQQILDCWTITSQLDTILEGILEHDLTQDQIANAVLGLKEIYEIKFDKAFRTFESVHGDICRITKQTAGE
jgi:hypothetical protein